MSVDIGPDINLNELMSKNSIVFAEFLIKLLDRTNQWSKGSNQHEFLERCVALVATNTQSLSDSFNTLSIAQTDDEFNDWISFVVSNAIGNIILSCLLIDMKDEKSNKAMLGVGYEFLLAVSQTKKDTDLN
jgi:hypothetical protein